MPTGRAGRPVPPGQLAWLSLTAAAAVASLLDTPFPDLAPLQNLPTLAIVAGVAAALRRWPLPTSAVACLCGFLLLHTLGGRYIYSYVPYDAWARALRLPAPTELFGFRRNHYDRLAHFGFGLLIVHPIEVSLRRHGGVGPKLSLYGAMAFVVAASALYEIFEWLLTLVMAGADADAYNGQQGDAWDSQKDMVGACLGALSAGIWLALRRQAAR